MRKLVTMLVILFSVYFGIQYFFYYFGKGHESHYEIKKENFVFKIKEVRTKNREKEIDNYYFDIAVEDVYFSFQTYEEFKLVKNVIKDIYYFKDDKYTCILPIFKENNSLSDVMCQNGSIVYNYNSIKGKSQKIDEYVNNLETSIYDKNMYIDSGNDKEVFDNITIEKDNLINKHNIVITTYKGITLISNDVTKVIEEKTLFSKDIYKAKISAVASQYYFVANYNQEHKFSEMFIADIMTGKISTIKYQRGISFDSYIQGVVDDNIYLFDRDAKKQYEIDPKRLTIVEVGNENTGIKNYENGNWSRAGAIAASNSDIIFNTVAKVEGLSGYNFINKTGNELSGYYYMYKKNGNNYDIYRSNVQNKEKVTYLFTTTNLKRLVYVNDYIYFEKDDYINVYHDHFGVKRIFKDTEFKFNNDLYYSVY